MYKLAIMVSGTGSNFMSIANAIKNNIIQDCEIACVIADREGTLAQQKAEELNIPNFCFPRKEYKQALSDKIYDTIEECGGADLIVLCGFLSILNGKILDKFKNRILNIHPSLIPSFCGDGMYGMHVHEAVIEYGAKVTGCTVHLVDSGTDTGPIVLQKVVPVMTDSPEELQKAVIVEEHKAIVEAVRYFAEGKIEIDGRKVEILY